MPKITQWFTRHFTENPRLGIEESESVYRRKTDNTMAKRKKYKRTNNELQNITHKTKHRVARILLKIRVETGAPEE